MTNSGIAVSDRPATVITRSVEAAAAQAGDRAAEDAERHDEHERDGRELERVHERRPEQVGDRAPGTAATCRGRRAGSA